jgi:hypothetical protein
MTFDDLYGGPEQIKQRHYIEQAYRRGVAQALSWAGDCVRDGGTADDLDQLTDLAMDWRYDRKPHPVFLDELFAAWRRGERGVTGINPQAFTGM